MRANSPSALFASLLLHAAVAAAIFLLGILLTRQPPLPPVIFELVAGTPNEALQRAPNVPSVDFNVPKAPPIPRPEPPAQPQPQPQPETKVETPPTPPKQKVEPKRPVPKEEPKKTVPKDQPKEQPKLSSYDEFVKQHGAPKVNELKVARPVNVPRIDTSKVISSAGAPTRGERGTAQSRAEADAMTVYLAALRDRLKEAHEQTKPGGLGDTVSAEVSFLLAANGQIDNVRIERSSGYPEFDRSVLEAFRRITWPGPRPDKKNESMRLTFRMRE